MHVFKLIVSFLSVHWRCQCFFPYCLLFVCPQVDMAALSQMGDSDLKEIGVPMVRCTFYSY
jgi:hypothetical protein